MQNKIKLFLVGIFVMLSIVLTIVIGLWFGVGANREYKTYTVVFHESIDGVTTDSVVKYNGVDVGQVKSIRLDTENLNNIIVDLSLDKTLPITAGTYATIRAQGISGLSIIKLGYDNSLKEIQKNGFIATKPSILQGLSDQAQAIGGNVQDISSSIKDLMDAKNKNNISDIINNLNTITNVFAKNSEHISEIILQLANVVHNVNSNTEHLNETIIEVAELSKLLQQNSSALNSILATVQNSTLKNVNNVLLPNINQAVINMSRTTREFYELLQSINQNPSIVLRGTKEEQNGPGET